MLVCLAYHPGDMAQAKNLLLWCGELDHIVPHHELLLVAASTVPQSDINSMHSVGRQVFPNTISIRQNVREEGKWPRASNAMFKTAVEWVRQKGNGPFLWLEPDAAPLVSGWLDKLQADYIAKGRPFYGTEYDKPFRHLNGVMIYSKSFASFNPYILGATDKPFDCVRPELTLKHGFNSPLIQRMLADPNENAAMSFPYTSSLSVIRKEAVLFHGCRDGTLIEQLKNSRNGHSTARSRVSLFKRLGGIFKKKSVQSKTIIVRRTGAIGDAIAATCVANLLREQGHSVVFQCHKGVQPVLRYCPGLTVADVKEDCDVNLDGAYENDKLRTSKHFADIFTETANRQLAKHQIKLRPLNIAPVLVVKEKDKQAAMKKYADRPRKWVGFAPRSNSFIVRTVPDEIWQQASEYIVGATCFWLGTHPAPKGNIVDLRLRDIGELVRCVANLDLVIAVDSGVAHISTALGIQTIVIGQSSSPELHFSDQRDFETICPIVTK